MLKGLKKAGEYIVYAGMFSTFLMAVVGTISIDIVLLAYLIKKTNENNSGANSFLTGYLWGAMFSGNQRPSTNPLILLIASPFLTGIAIGLSFLLGVPQVGIVLAVGWGISLGIVGIGAGISKLADIGLEVNAEPAITPDFIHHDNEYTYTPSYSFVNRDTQSCSASVHHHPQAYAECRGLYSPRLFSIPTAVVVEPFSSRTSRSAVWSHINTPHC